jgi:hypothetical protein
MSLHILLNLNSRSEELPRESTIFISSSNLKCFLRRMRQTLQLHICLHLEVIVFELLRVTKSFLFLIRLSRNLSEFEDYHTIPVTKYFFIAVNVMCSNISMFISIKFN